VVCNGGRIKGQPGVAMDDLVYVCTKIARQMDAAGIDKVRAGAAAAGSLGFNWLVATTPAAWTERHNQAVL
jgi:hypothetical protein